MRRLKGRPVGFRWLHDRRPEVLFKYDTINYIPFYSAGSCIPELAPVPDTHTEWVEVSEAEFEELYNDRLVSDESTD